MVGGDHLTQPETVEHASRLLIDRRSHELFKFTTEAIGWYPEDPEIRFLYATALLAVCPEDVPWQIATAIQLEPDNPWRVTRAAAMLFTLGEIAAARSYVGHAASLAPRDFEYGPELALLGGQLAALEGEDAIAEEGFGVALEAEPRRPEFVIAYAGFLRDRDRETEALALVDDALTGAPDDEGLRRLREELTS